MKILKQALRSNSASNTLVNAFVCFGLSLAFSVLVLAGKVPMVFFLAVNFALWALNWLIIIKMLSSYFESQEFKIREYSGEVVREIITGDDNLGISIKLSDIRLVSSHYHNYIKEHIVLLEGRGVLEVDGEKCGLEHGVVYTVPCGAVHKIISETAKACRCLVISVPHWTEEDDNECFETSSFR